MYSGKFLDDHPAVSAVVLVKVDLVDLSVTELYGTILLCELQMMLLYKDNQEKGGKSVDVALFLPVLTLFHDIAMQRKTKQHWSKLTRGQVFIVTPQNGSRLQTTASLEP